MNAPAVLHCEVYIRLFISGHGPGGGGGEIKVNEMRGSRAAEGGEKEKRIDAIKGTMEASEGAAHSVSMAVTIWIMSLCYLHYYAL